MTLTPDILYKKLQKKYGNLNWWPKDNEYHEKNNSDPRFEVIIGAILTQNTAWPNVEKALKNLKEKKILEINKITKTNIKYLQETIKPSGFYKQKAQRLKKTAEHLKTKYNANLDIFFNRDIYEIRNELLNLNGIGPETADSILLYAGNLPVFVVDAYTKRICERLPLNTNISYHEIQKFFETNLKQKYKEKEIIKIYNNLHAQIVILAKTCCKKKPLCAICPLQNDCKFPK